MAVYTPVSADDLTAFLAGYDVGAAVSFKGKETKGKEFDKKLTKT